MVCRVYGKDVCVCVQTRHSPATSTPREADLARPAGGRSGTLQQQRCGDMPMSWSRTMLLALLSTESAAEHRRSPPAFQVDPASAYERLAAPCIHSGRTWILLLGDSLLRHMFFELATRLCSRDHIRTLTNATKGSSLANYHNSRVFCVDRQGCSQLWVGATTSESPYDVRNSPLTKCSESEPAPLHANPPLCVAYGWAKYWSDGFAQLSSGRRSCAWPPRAVVTNIGLHELMDHAESAKRHAHESLECWLNTLEEAGVRSAVLQSVASINERLTAAHPQRRRLRNTGIVAYNAAAAQTAERTPSKRVCLRAGVSDAFNLSSDLSAKGLSRTSDGIHWGQPFDAQLTTTNMQLACQPVWKRGFGRSCLQARSAPSLSSSTCSDKVRSDSERKAKKSTRARARRVASTKSKSGSGSFIGEYTRAIARRVQSIKTKSGSESSLEEYTRARTRRVKSTKSKNRSESSLVEYTRRLADESIGTVLGDVWSWVTSLLL